MSAVLTVARREYRQIAKTRAFRLTLILVPVMLTLSLMITTMIKPPAALAW
jgi:ABC-type Na+ efflux pump permease subunit